MPQPVSIRTLFFAGVYVLALVFSSPLNAQQEPAELPAQAPPQKIELDLHKRFLVFTEPRRPDGTIDYIAALNKKYSEGVTQDNNAFRGLFLLFDHIQQGELEEEWSAIPGQMEALGLTVEDLKRGPHWIDRYDYFEQIGYDTEAYDERFEADPLQAVRAKELRAWLALNEAVLERALVALNKPRYWSPLVPGDEQGLLIATLLPSLGQHRMLARGLRDWVYVLVADEQYGKALEVLDAMRSLARLQTHHPTIIANLVGVSIDAIALDTLRHLVASRALPGDVLAELDAMLRARPPRVPMAEAVRDGEACAGLDAYLQIMSGRVGMGTLVNAEADVLQAFFGDKRFDINRGVKKVSLYYKQLARTLAVEDYADRQRLATLFEEQYTAEWEAARQRFFIRVGEAVVPNPVAILNKENRTDAVTTMFMAIMMPALNAAGKTETRSLATEACTYAVIACERYRLEHGGLPHQLADLVPAYLKEVPTDPFSGEAVLYNKRDNGFVVYSVYDNLQDDGGIEFMPQQPDPPGEDFFGFQQRERADWLVEIQYKQKK